MILNSDYWENRYKTNQTGWDTGGVAPPLKSFIDNLKSKDTKILIPGCGNGYEVEYLWNKGFKRVFAADFAKTPLTNLKSRIPDLPEHQLILGDFFDIEDSFDLILEYTFFCALNPELRAPYVEKTHTLLNEGGLLTGLFFDFPLTESGPPFGGSEKEYVNHFDKKFKIQKLVPSINSLTERQGKELFFIFEKKTL